jgi:hypothetical protein
MLQIFRISLVILATLAPSSLMAQSREGKSMEYPTFYRTAQVDGLSILVV